MQALRIKNADIQCLEPCDDGAPLAFLCLDASGGDAFDSMRPGVIVHDSRKHLASDAKESWTKHNFVFGRALWTPVYDDEGDEVPVHQNTSGLYLQVWLGVQVFAGHSLGVQDGAHVSELWGYGSMASIIPSLAGDILETSPVFDDGSEGDDNWGKPSPMTLNRLGDM